VRLLLPDGKVNQQPGRDMHVIHDAKRTGIHLRRPVVPHKVTQPGRHDAQPHQDAPLQAGGRQFLRIPQQEPGDNSHSRGAKVKPGKGVVLRHRACFHQALIPHHADGETEVGKLHKHQARPEVVADFVVTDNRRTHHRQ